MSNPEERACSRPDGPNCKHLTYALGFWCINSRCIKARGTTIPGIKDCPFYSQMVIEDQILDDFDWGVKEYLKQIMDDFDRDIQEYDEWRDRCIRGGVIGSVIVLVAYALFVWWMLS